MSGYEKVATLMARNVEMAMFQRFHFLNNLNILYLQAELVHLEGEMKNHMRNGFRSGEDPTVAAAETQPADPRGNPENIAEEMGGQAVIPSTVIQHNANSVHEVEGVNTTNALLVHEGTAITVTTGPNSSKGRESSPANITEETVPTTTLEVPSSPSDEATLVDTGPITPKTTTPISEAAIDWRCLARWDEHKEAWKTMLKAREKLKEYNETLLIQTQLHSHPSPNKADLHFMQSWLSDENLGDEPLIAADSHSWDSTSPNGLIALSPRKSEDPLGHWVLETASDWWHRAIGHRVKMSVDEENQYIEYKDETMLRLADGFGSILASVLLIISILVLHFVTNMVVRLGVVAIFTTLFSLALMLFTSAKKSEVFSGTTA